MKKKGNGLIIFLIILLLFFGFFVGIPMIAKITGLYPTPDGGISREKKDDKDPKVDLRVITSDIPESVSNRGLILRGITADSDPRPYMSYYGLL